jgi:hypothetical protein
MTRRERERDAAALTGTEQRLLQIGDATGAGRRIVPERSSPGVLRRVGNTKRRFRVPLS